MVIPDQVLLWNWWKDEINENKCMDWQRLTWVWDSERLTRDFSSATASRPKKRPWPGALSLCQQMLTGTRLDRASIATWSDITSHFRLWYFPTADNLRRIGQDLHWTSRLFHRHQQRVRGRTQHVWRQRSRGVCFSQTWQAKRLVCVMSSDDIQTLTHFIRSFCTRLAFAVADPGRAGTQI